MAQPQKRKQPNKRKPKQPKDDDGLSGWTVEAKPLEPVRLRPVAPSLWRDNLKRLRKDFLYARKQHGPLRCPLFQVSTSKADAQQPPFDRHAGHVGFHAQLYHDFRWHVTADRKPIYLKHPIVDVKGTPIVDSRGRGLLCEMPTGREWSYCGTSPGSAQFRKLAERAGRALLGSARHTIAWIPPDTLFTQMDEHRWLWAAFDLAWQGRHPSLRAERKTWFRPREPIPNVESDVVYVPYDCQQLRSMRDGGLASVLNFPEEWTERLPGYFISELSDLFQASADLVDMLLDKAGHPATDPKQVHQLKPPHARPKSAGGRPPVPEDEARKRKDLVVRWHRAKDKGVRQEDFCSDNKVQLKYLTKCLNWLEQRRRRNDKQ